MEFVKGEDFVFVRTSTGMIGKATFNEETNVYHLELRGLEFGDKLPERTHKDSSVEQLETSFQMGFSKVVGRELWDFVNVVDEISKLIGIPSKIYLLSRRLEREGVSSVDELNSLQLKNATFHFKRKLKALEETLKK
ncbi:hypothetical protein [Listeria booriae]|uniref:hypothetical protein n=1 Tax=Listeria booriae TaxID=1552123 RepID=UPI00163DA89B|nr:hypothetical protein [Listeria booriae]MBC1307937.1 hypothetical protein [Listeria booriae]